MIGEESLRARDDADPLRAKRDLFELPPGKIYLDGNSLGVLPKGVREHVMHVVNNEWRDQLIASWGARWFHLPMRVGDQIAPLIGAKSGEVVVGDSTSVNLFKCLAAALTMRPDRRVIVTEAENFPTDNYIVQGIAEMLGGYDIRYVEAGTDPRGAIDATVAAVTLTHVNYRTAEIHDMNAVTRAAHEAGAPIVWDLSHSVGALAVDVAAAGADFAVGCTYKYLNGGPGSPAFAYVPAESSALQQPLSGWMGHLRPFAFDLRYQPAEAARRFMCGTPQILSLTALSKSLEVWKDVDMALVRAKSLALTDLFMSLIEAECAGFNLEIVTPRDADRRGSHVSIACDVGYPAMRALADRGIVGDFRAPNLMRFGFTPLYCSYADVAGAVRTLKAVLVEQAWRDERYSLPQDVT
jgi:kynureninase